MRGMSRSVLVAVALLIPSLAHATTGTVSFVKTEITAFENYGTVQVEVEYKGPGVDVVTVQYATSADTATSPEDYAATSGTLVFPAGESYQKQTITITLVQGAPGNGDHFFVKLSNATNASLITPEAKITLWDTDSTFLQFALTAVSVKENIGTALIEVKRSGSASGVSTVQYETIDDSATQPDDYEKSTGTLTFAVGETSKTFPVKIVYDKVAESAETVSLKLSNPTGALLGIGDAATLEITDVPWPKVEFSAATYEGDETSGKVTITVQLSDAAEHTVTVKYKTGDDTATEPDDYEKTSGELTFDPETTSLSFEVPVKKDYKKELDETVTLTLSSPSGADLGTISTAVLTIKEYVPDVTVTFSPDPVYAVQNAVANVTATVAPSSFEPDVTFQIANTSIAGLYGAYPNLMVCGLAKGTTELQARCGDYDVGTVTIHVVTISYSPTSGPVFTGVDFTIDAPTGADLFSAETTVAADGIYTPEDSPDEPISLEHSTAKVKWDSNQPNVLSLAVAEVLPSSLSNSNNPGIIRALTGVFNGTVKFKNGSVECPLPVFFEITPSAFIGRYTEGVFEKLSLVPVWSPASAEELVGVPSEKHLYAQILRPVNEFTESPPSTITAEVRSFLADETPVAAGVTVTFDLISTESGFYVYQSCKPLLMVADTALEGEHDELYAVAGAEDARTHVIRLPP